MIKYPLYIYIYIYIYKAFEIIKSEFNIYESCMLLPTRFDHLGLINSVAVVVYIGMLTL